jgi:hypothetical protein
MEGRNKSMGMPDEQDAIPHRRRRTLLSLRGALAGPSFVLNGRCSTRCPGRVIGRRPVRGCSPQSKTLAHHCTPPTLPRNADTHQRPANLFAVSQPCARARPQSHCRTPCRSPQCHCKHCPFIPNRRSFHDWPTAPRARFRLRLPSVCAFTSEHLDACTSTSAHRSPPR